jgi:hypothetical protein
MPFCSLSHRWGWSRKSETIPKHHHVKAVAITTYLWLRLGKCGTMGNGVDGAVKAKDSSSDVPFPFTNQFSPISHRP